jgi:dihydrofolate reductase
MKVNLIAVLSVNGKISRSNNVSIDWNSKEDLEWFKNITKNIGVVILGRRTFETFKSPLKGRLNIVMTRSPLKSWRDDLIFTSSSPGQILEMIGKLGYTQTAVIGGQEIFTLFMREKLVDDLYITYEPILIDGIDLLSQIQTDVKLKLIDMKMLNSQTFMIHYAILY